jgi:hypothetical protein
MDSASARIVVFLGGRSFDMVAMVEIAFLVALLVLGIWWFRRTNLYRSRHESGTDPGQSDAGARHSVQKLPPKGGPWV